VEHITNDNPHIVSAFDDLRGRPIQFIDELLGHAVHAGLWVDSSPKADTKMQVSRDNSFYHENTVTVLDATMSAEQTVRASQS